MPPAVYVQHCQGIGVFFSVVTVGLHSVTALFKFYRFLSALFILLDLISAFLHSFNSFLHTAPYPVSILSKLHFPLTETPFRHN